MNIRQASTFKNSESTAETGRAVLSVIWQLMLLPLHCKPGLKTNSAIHGRIGGRIAAAVPLNPMANNANLPDTHPAKLLKTGHAQTLMVKKLSENAVLPKRGSARAAGYDLARCGLGWEGDWVVCQGR